MSGPSPYYELRCRACTWTEVCGTEAIARWLLKAGKIRPGREPELEIMLELLHAAASRLACPGCGSQGLTLGPADDAAEWPGQLACAACGKSIPLDRLEALPEVTLCAACQRDEERGCAKVEVEYCPKCGAPMALRPSKTPGVTRYQMVCTAVPPCRR